MFLMLFNNLLYQFNCLKNANLSRLYFSSRQRFFGWNPSVGLVGIVCRFTTIKVRQLKIFSLKLLNGKNIIKYSVLFLPSKYDVPVIPEVYNEGVSIFRKRYSSRYVQ